MAYIQFGEFLCNYFLGGTYFRERLISSCYFQREPSLNPRQHRYGIHAVWRVSLPLLLWRCLILRAPTFELLLLASASFLYHKGGGGDLLSQGRFRDYGIARRINNFIVTGKCVAQRASAHRSKVSYVQLLNERYLSQAHGVLPCMK